MGLFWMPGLLALSVASLMQSEKVVVGRSLSDGASSEYTLKGDFVLEFTGSTVAVEARLKKSFKGQVKDGELKDMFAHVIEWLSMGITLDGQDLGDMDRTPPPVKLFLKNDGSIARLTADGGGVEGEIARLVATVMAVPFPPEGIELGGRWKLAAEALKHTSVRGGAEYALVALEELEGVKAAKLRAVLKGEPRDDDTELSISADLWLNRDTGELIKGVATVKQLIVQGMVVNGYVRIEGKKREAAPTINRP